MKRSARAGRRSAGLVLAALVATGTFGADRPYVPDDDGEAVERLPASSLGLRRDLARAAAEPRDRTRSMEETLVLAWRAVESGQRLADPRYLGYAQALLAPWWKEPDASAEVLLLRATILQSRHSFEAALRDLDRVLERDPRRAQAWLTRAMILQTRGRPAAALQSCVRLLTGVTRLVSATCAAVPALQLGRGHGALRLLTLSLDAHREADGSSDTGVLGWAYRTRARLAEALGEHALARSTLLDALALDAEAVASLTAYADFLLRHDEPRAVVDLLADKRSTPMLSLRLAEAERALGAPAFAARSAALRTYFATQEARGDELHLREAARAYLRLFDDPDKALALARANWAAQREAEDARLLIAAAYASGRPRATRPVREWMRREGIVEPGLSALLDAAPVQVRREADHAQL